MWVAITIEAITITRLSTFDIVAILFLIKHVAIIIIKILIYFKDKGMDSSKHSSVHNQRSATENDDLTP